MRPAVKKGLKNLKIAARMPQMPTVRDVSIDRTSA